MPNLVKDRGKRKIEALQGASRWRGSTNIASGDSAIAVTATQAKSGAAIVAALGLTTVGSHRDLVTSINSIVDNTSFMIVVQNAVIDTQQVVFTIID